jgi:hypothetical protein
VREFNHDSREADRPAQWTGYAEWIALGAVAAGAVGAIVGMANCSRPRKSSAMAGEPIDPMTITAPHGDKLRDAVV